jgi:hypothetical protein
MQSNSERKEVGKGDLQASFYCLTGSDMNSETINDQFLWGGRPETNVASTVPWFQIPAELVSFSHYDVENEWIQIYATEILVILLRMNGNSSL